MHTGFVQRGLARSAGRVLLRRTRLRRFIKHELNKYSRIKKNSAGLGPCTHKHASWLARGDTPSQQLPTLHKREVRDVGQGDHAFGGVLSGPAADASEINSRGIEATRRCSAPDSAPGLLRIAPRGCSRRRTRVRIEQLCVLCPSCRTEPQRSQALLPVLIASVAIAIESDTQGFWSR